MQTIPEVDYTRTGDVLLAYQVLGEGDQTLLLVNGFVSHLECIWEEPGLRAFLETLSQNYRLILFDKRGVGLSERISAPPRLEDTLEDILAILQACQCDRVSLLGVSEGGPPALLFAATYPQKVENLILYGSMPKWIRNFDYPWALSRIQYEQWMEQMVAGWGSAVSLDRLAPSQLNSEAFKSWWARALRMATSPASMRAILNAMQTMDVRDALSHVRAPSLILHRRLDQAVPFEGGRYLAQHIANSNLQELPGEDHFWWTEYQTELLDHIQQFLSRSRNSDTATSGDSDVQLSEALTKRELDVLRLAKVGYTNQQIADELHLSLGTVKTYSSALYGKLNARNRTEAIAIARKLGLIV